MSLFDWQQTQAAREAIAGAFPDVAIITCVRILHPLDTAGGWLWADWDRDFEALDAEGFPVTFEAKDFTITFGRNSPTDAIESTGNLATAFDERLYEFARLVSEFVGSEPFTVEVFWYLETDPSEPAFKPRWFWRSHRIRATKTAIQMELAARTLKRTSRAARYTYEEWPTLAGWDFVT